MTVSVVIPAYNRKPLLRRALLSVSAQTRPADEVWVVDDGSTDGTEAMVAAEFPAVEYVYQENRGVSAARNRGIEAASGEWIALLDSDDEWTPEKLERQLSAIDSEPSYKVCHCDEIWVRNGVRVNPRQRHRKSGGWIFRRCLPLCAISPSAVVIHRSVFESVGLFDETMPACEDYDLWLRVCSRMPVLYVDEPLVVKYGGHEDQLSSSVPALDRYRIEALERIVAAGVLNDGDRQAALRVLAEKLTVYAAGAEKRGRETEAQRLRVRRAEYLTEFSR